MITFATMPGLRMVAAPAALDAATVPFPWVGLRLAPDELLMLADPAAHSAEPRPIGWSMSVEDDQAITEPEDGLSGAWLDREAFDHVVRPHIDWAIPLVCPVLAQGLVAGVPCKLWFSEPDSVLILCSTSHVHELEALL